MTEAVELPVSNAPKDGGAKVSGVEASSVEAGEPERTGWVRLDTDNVIRGWTTDRHDRADRAMVEVSIDGTRVATIRADRYDPKLAELGEGDGGYAFALLVPRRFRDGFQHTLSAMAAGYALKCKAPGFSIPGDAAEPRLELIAATPHYAHCRLTGGQYFKSVALELWIDGERQAELVETVRLKGGDELTLRYGAERLASWFGHEVVVAGPGMIEAGAPGLRLLQGVGLTAARAEGGRLSVELGGGFSVPDGVAAELHVREIGDGAAEAVRLPVGLSSGAGVVDLPSDLGGGPLDVRLVCDGVALPQFTARAAGPADRLIVNGAFHRWTAAGPAGWSSDLPADQILRDRFAFAPEMAQGLTGDTAALKLTPGRAGEVVLLRQSAPSPHGGTQLAILLRASGPAALKLRLVEPSGGAELAVMPVAADPSGDWRLLEQTVTPQEAAGGEIVLELVAEADPGAPETCVEVAGIRLGDLPIFHDGIDGEAHAESAEPAAGANLVRNAELVRWPHGLALSVSRERTETAEGWYVVNRRTRAPVRAVATSAEAGPDGGFGLTLAADEIADGCRLEAALDGRSLARAGGVRLSFEAGCGPAARRMRGGAYATLPEFLLIDRIMLLRRTTVAHETQVDLTDRTLAVVARRVLITRTMERFEFFAPLDAEPEEGAVEYLLAFEFRQPFAITLQRPCLTVEAAPRPPAPPPYLALEDRAIAAQAGLTHGLEEWTALVPMRPRPGEPAAPDAVVEHWSWGVAGGRTIEVAVCVHNAADAALACLRSLAGASRAPHTVLIVDDASDADTSARIAGFIADKPWMRMVRNPKNLGYTASANRALKESEADWVILLNSDTVVTAGWIEGMLECAASDPAIAMVGPMSNAASYQSVPELYDADNKWKVNLPPPGWSPARMAQTVRAVSQKAFPQVPLLNGFCTLIRRSVFLEAGGFNETAFPGGYGEENDLCTRMSKAGYKLAVADHVYVHHEGSASFGAARRTALSKAADKALKAQHPDVNYGALGARLRELPALVNLRAAVRDALPAGG